MYRHPVAELHRLTISPSLNYVLGLEMPGAVHWPHGSHQTFQTGTSELGHHEACSARGETFARAKQAGLAAANIKM